MQEHTYSKNFNSWNFHDEECLVLDLNDEILVYQALYFKTKDEEGYLAYSDKIKDLKVLRNELVKAKHFKPTDLFLTKFKNIIAIQKKKREMINV